MRKKLDYARELVLNVPSGVYALCHDLADALPKKASSKDFVESANKLLDEIASELCPNSEYVDTEAGELVAKARREWDQSFAKVVNVVCPPRYANLVLAYYSASRR